MIKEIFGKKIGVTQIFNSNGNLQMVTLVEVEPAYILEKVDYPSKSVVKIGCFKVREERISKVKKPILGYFNKLGTPVFSLIREVETSPDADFSFLVTTPTPPKDSAAEEKAKTTKDARKQKKVVAQQKAQEVAEKKEETKQESKEQEVEEVEPFASKREIGVEIFKEGDIVDAQAKTKGRGFAGGMKRHGWHGQPKSHGSTSHRRVGSVGSNTFPGRIFKGHRMPGHMGDAYQAIKNLQVLKVDKDKNLIFLSGAIAGCRGAIVRIKKVRS